MKNTLIAVAIICGILLTVSCSKESTRVPLNIGFQGLSLQPIDKGFKYYGEVPPEGVDFTITSPQPLRSITVDKCVYWNENGLPDISSGTWGGRISISSSGDSFIKYDIHISENNDMRNRNISLTFGKANEYCIVNLFQCQL